MIINGDPVPAKISFIDPDNEIIVIDDNFELPDNISDYSLFVLDTNDFPNTGNTYKVLNDKISNMFIIDHHEGDSLLIENNYIKVEASSACEIVHELYKFFEVTISKKAAIAMYTGMVFDTGSFRYKKTSEKTFSAAADLVRAGANPTEIYEKLFENNDLNKFLLQAEMLKTVETHFDGKMILMYLTPDMLKKTEANFSDGETNINLPLKLKGVCASVLIKQDLNSPLKVSMRTKGDYDVSKIAIKHGGGGHKNAAGFKSPFSMEETYSLVLKEIGSMLSE